MIEFNSSINLSKEKLDLMPHQDPFLFIDEAKVVLDKVFASYQITGNEDFLRGHFKHNPVFPASIMIEALGQLGVYFLLANDDKSILQGEVDPNTIYFTSCDGIRCFRVCRPGDVIKMSIKVTKIRRPLAIFEGSIFVEGKKTAKAESITLLFDYKK